MVPSASEALPVHDRANDDRPSGASLELSRAVLTSLRNAGVPFLVGGGYAFIRYTGIERPLKDFDVFLRERDWPAAVEALRQSGIATTLPFPHWLGKAVDGHDFVDIIYGSGNGVAPVDDQWFRFAVDDEILGVPVKLVPMEELVWTKAFVMERERYDGGDVIHLVRVCGRRLDWARLVARFGDNWQVLLGHLVFFGFVYPSERGLVPADVMATLLERLDRAMRAPPGERVCRGTLISRAQYLVDIEQWGYIDPREAPRGGMSEAEIEQWTEAIDQPGP
jgi:hypothetical protein